jgi:hypothetical protein
LARRVEDVSQDFDVAISRAVRYQDIERELARVAPTAFLLVGEFNLAEMSAFEWNEPLRLPWGTNRFLLSGSRVSRGT